jgi:hypothetical protein
MGNAPSEPLSYIPRSIGRLNNGGTCPSDREKIDGLCYRRCPPDKAHVPGAPYLCRQVGVPVSQGRGVGKAVPINVRLKGRKVPYGKK